MASWQRTHTCGDLREADVGKTVVLNGWVNTYRSYNDQVFVDLRDRYGITQVVFEAEDNAALFTAAQEIRNEWVLSVRGTVRLRLPNKHNPKLATGDVELLAQELRILNRCPTPPFEVMSVPLEGRVFGDPELAGEDLRLQYRYLDLRRPILQRTLALRHRINKVIRDYLDVQGFIEVETPLLGRSTPEGARDYLVPSRVFPGNWYALPQSPQLYKQLLMVAGYDKYFQIARCLRDEDLRADRQPEFTQLDLEMSFVEMEDIFAVIEGLMAEVFKRSLGVDIALPLPRLAVCRCHAPLRQRQARPALWPGNCRCDRSSYGLTARADPGIGGQGRQGPRAGRQGSGGEVLAQAHGRAARLRPAPGPGNGGSHCRCLQGGGGKTRAASSRKRCPRKGAGRNASGSARSQATSRCSWAAARRRFARLLGTTRTRLAEELKLYDPAGTDYKIAWVYDFPSFLWDTDEKRWAANHHPFTAPMDEDVDKLETAPGAVRAKAYDLVINGYECGGGSIRIHNPDVQARLFAVLGMTPEQAKQRFGFLLDALKYGAPPHGGIALGLDRLTMMLARTGEHPRRDRLSQKPKGPRPDDRRPGPGGSEAAQGAGALGRDVCHGQLAARATPRRRLMS